MKKKEIMLVAFNLILQIFTKTTNFDLIHILNNFKCRNQNSPKVLKLNHKHEGNRTLDFQNRNLMLYPLSYTLLFKSFYFQFIIL